MGWEWGGSLTCNGRWHRKDCCLCIPYPEYGRKRACARGQGRTGSSVWGEKISSVLVWTEVCGIYTDHKSLVGLFSEVRAVPPLAAACVQHWALMLTGYEYTIVYRDGQKNANADPMSRLPLPKMPEETLVPLETIMLLDHMDKTIITSESIKQWMRCDPVLFQALWYTLTGWSVQCPSVQL